MIFTLSWIETVPDKASIDLFLSNLTDGEYVGVNESTGLHEIMAKETFEAPSMEVAKNYVKDVFIELIDEQGELKEFGCQSDTGEYFSNEDL